MKQTWASALMQYYLELTPFPLPNGVEWLHPQLRPEVQETMHQFFKKYFNDTQERILMLGINPGRFGAGITGVNFTAPRQLSHPCGIEHFFGNASELSAEFIYHVVAAFGGPEVFYQQVFIGSVCPLGFVKGGKNLNYYDDKTLLQAVTPFIAESMRHLVSLNINRHRCVCIGEDKNYRHLQAWNSQYGWFHEIVPVPHPRFVMQYRRRQKLVYIEAYLRALAV